MSESYGVSVFMRPYIPVQLYGAASAGGRASKAGPISTAKAAVESAASATLPSNSLVIAMSSAARNRLAPTQSRICRDYARLWPFPQGYHRYVNLGFPQGRQVPRYTFRGKLGSRAELPVERIEMFSL